MENSVLVLSQDNFLFEIIKSNLEQIGLEVGRFNLPSPGNKSSQATRTGRNSLWDTVDSEEFGLIVLAMSAPVGEPVVTLFDADLITEIGHIPLLIISEREFEANPDGQIYHLQFPFESDDLRHTVQQLLT